MVKEVEEENMKQRGWIGHNYLMERAMQFCLLYLLLSITGQSKTVSQKSHCMNFLLPVPQSIFSCVARIIENPKVSSTSNQYLLKIVC